MVDEQKSSANASVPEAEQKEELIKFKAASGEEVTLEKNALAIVVMMDPISGQTSIYNLQNCSIRPASKMLMNEALATYDRTSIANTTVIALAGAFKKDEKKAIFNPFKRG